MDVLRRVADARAFRASVPGSLGFVPTLGALHAGHGSLVERAVRERAAAIASLFVNPTQFGPGEDLAAYPRREAEDLAFLERLGCSAVFVPSVEEMYPPGDDTRVQPGAIAARLEGAARPGHLTGVATVVTKLFAVVRPDVAYFGQKDFQQLRVVQALAGDLRLGVRVVGCPTVRDEDGLALSSRNAYLSTDERRAALALPRGLFAARADWERGERDPKRLADRVRQHAAALALEYVSVADPLTLDSVTDFYGVRPESRGSVRFSVPSDATGEVTIAVNAVLEGPAGPIRITRYAVGAPGAQPRPARQPIVLRPCRLDAPAGSPDRGLTILCVYAPPTDSGRYSLSVPGISLPVGAAGARFDVTLTCVRDTQAASASCR